MVAGKVDSAIAISAVNADILVHRIIIVERISYQCPGTGARAVPLLNGFTWIKPARAT